MEDHKTLEEISIEMSVDGTGTEDISNEPARKMPELRVNTARSDDSECKTSSSSSGRKKRFLSPSETLVKTFSPIVSPAIIAAKTVIPKVEPISFRTFCGLTFKVAIPVILYILLFTTMGFGESCFSYLAEMYGKYSEIVGVGTAAFILALYMLDSSSWNSNTGKQIAVACWSIAIAGIIVLILLLADKFPYGPLAFFATVTPLWLVVLKGVSFSELTTRTYISWLSGPLYFTSLLTGVLWLGWTFLRDENEWNNVTRFTYADDYGCLPDLAEFPECESKMYPGEVCVTYSEGIFQYDTASTGLDASAATADAHCPQSCSRIYHNCLNTFILWIGPLMTSLILLFLSFFTTFLKTDIGERDMINFGKLWLVLLFAVWVASSLAGVAAGLTSALMALTLASFVGSAVFVSASISYSEQKDYAKSLRNRVLEKYGSLLDITKGLAVAMLSPAFLVYLGLDIVNQAVRKIGLRCSKQFKTEEEKSDIFTRKARRHIEAIRSWERSTVLTYAIYWGGAFFLMNVAVAKLTVLFLSWLIQITSSFGLGAVTGIMVGVGLLMFLLPPVPGVPIYLTSGIVMLAAGRDVLGITGSLVYGCFVSLILKLLACTLQQKVIGENLANFVSVRRLVGINSDLIKSMKLILNEPGMSYAKVAILVGGPDWPTSVLCGLMKLDLIPILLGTIPVAIIIVPTLLTGSFTYMASLELENGEKEFPWASVLKTIMAAISAMVQISAMITAAYFLEQTSSTRREEIAALEVDKEVKELEDKDQRFNECYKLATKWADLPTLPKAILTLAVLSMIFACYMVQLFSADCFATYQLTYTIEENLDGNWLNLILPLGRIASLLFFVSCGLLLVYMQWATKAAKEILTDGVVDNAHRPDSVTKLDSPSDEESKHEIILSKC
ncbi:unnamed protein product [Cylindrotheca closterium]|uniref:Uncharacterized protein n=1 Tax=Cylindrotheca closterium TaxID=2856 RepID=A0AAD2FTF0_9STRA|nr:unnamed protein product [Cylindrotheca closterium]